MVPCRGWAKAKAGLVESSNPCLVVLSSTEVVSLAVVVMLRGLTSVLLMECTALINSESGVRRIHTNSSFCKQVAGWSAFDSSFLIQACAYGSSSEGDGRWSEGVAVVLVMLSLLSCVWPQACVCGILGEGAVRLVAIVIDSLSFEEDTPSKSQPN